MYLLSRVDPIDLGDGYCGTTALRMLVKGKDDFESLLSELEKNSKKDLTRLILCLKILREMKLEDMIGKFSWLKRMKGLDGIYQLRVNQNRTYFFSYNKSDRYIVFLNHCQKKRNRTDQKVLDKAKRWKEEAEGHLD